MSRAPHTRPQVSVVMGVYQAGRYLAEALESVAAQGVAGVEIVVMDDGSTDDTQAVCRAVAARLPAALPLRVFAQANAGAGAARNGALAQARGRHVAFLDGDDFWPGNRLREQLAAFAADDTLEAVFGRVANFRDVGGERRLEPSLPSRLGTAGLFTREAIDRVGPFAAGRGSGDLADWAERSTRLLTQERMLDTLVGYRRLHDANSGLIERDGHRAAYLEMVRRRLAARRAAPVPEPPTGGGSE